VKQGKYNRALKHSFLEMYGIGEFGEYYQQASELYSRITELDDLEGGEELQIFDEHVENAQQYAEEGSIDDAIEQWQMARDILEESGHLEGKEDSILWQQYHAGAGAMIVYLSHNLENTQTEELEELADTAKAEFESMIHAYPGFVPPVTELSKLALHRGDRVEAKRLWQQAHDMMPLNHFVYEQRYALEEIVPDAIQQIPNNQYPFPSKTVKEEP
jgi:tetratricopeptide (TPR) repeat protein